MYDTDGRLRQADRGDFLRNSDEFRNLPLRIQDLILKSPNASADFENFFQNGGVITPAENEPLGAYRAEPRREIRINRDQFEFAKSREGVYAAERLFAMLSHEIGHDKERNLHFPGNGTPAEYVQFKSDEEAKAIFNAFSIFLDLGRSEPSFQPQWNAIGYDSTGMRWASLNADWHAGHMDDKAVIGEISKSVPAFPYTRDDLTGDKFKTWGDYYLEEFKNLKRSGPTLPSDASQDAGNIGPPSPGHRDHSLYQQVRAHVQRLDAECGRTADEVSDRLTASLMCLAKQNGLSQVDHVVLSERNENGRVIRGENVFVVQGAVNDPAHHRGCMSMSKATICPEKETYRNIDSLNFQLDQQQALHQQQQNAQQTPEVHQHVMCR